MVEIVMSLVRQFANLSFVQMLPGNDLIKTLYSGTVIFGIVYGGIRGGGRWISWLDKRKRVVIKQPKWSPIGSEMVSPIINIGRDAGVMAWFIITSGAISGVITATFPISVPIMLQFSEEDK